MTTRQRRGQARCLIDLPLKIWDASRNLIDDKSVAHDVTTSGFGFETRTDISRLRHVIFELRLPDGGTASGSASLVWSRHEEWGTWAGAKISRLSRGEGRKIRKVIHGPGFDWVGLWDRALVAGALVVAGMLLQELLAASSRGLAFVPWLLLGVCAGAFAYLHLRD
ncbi:MAG: hypothetical protein PHF00_05905 [Elusimicrobia bacterium]|nr:hypothetical protein [Elusimicrobiota bacterium]